MRSPKVVEKNIYSTLVKLKKSLSESADGAKSHAAEMVTDLLEDMDSVRSEAQGYAQQYVKSYPLKSIGIAAAVGILFGKFIL